MLEDFIKQNNINAKIICFTTITTNEQAIKSKKFLPNLVAKIQLFNSLKNDPFIIISSFNSVLNIEKIKKVVGLDSNEDLLEANFEESIEITGYKKGFIPPISIFGLKIIIDSSLEKKDFLYFRISEKSFLKISLESIIENNEDVLFENIVLLN